MNKNFGTVEYKGKTITLDEQAYQTSRLMNEYGSDLQSQGNGKTYMDEWAACGHTSDGAKVKVIWHFEITRGDETLPEDYNWDNVHNVKRDE